MGEGSKVVNDMHVGQSQQGWPHVRRCRSTIRVRGDTLMTPDHTVIQVHSSGYGRARFCLSSWEGLNTGRHEKAPGRCPCSRLATLHGAQRMRMLGVDLITGIQRFFIKPLCATILLC